MRITQSSGYQTLDKGVWNGIVNAAPFPPLPSDFKGDHLSTRIRFLYTGEDEATAKAVLPQALPISVLNNPAGVDFGPYLSVVHDRISRLWPGYVPSGLPELKKRSEVEIQLDIGRDGRVANMRITQSSGYQTLDKGVWNGIVNAAPFPPLPSDFKGDHLSTRMRFVYPGEVQMSKTQPKSKQ
jgi:TonB family protein